MVIGYGTARRRDLTGSVTSIQGKTIAQIPVTGTAQAMAGRMAGVQVTSTDGSPDAEILVRCTWRRFHHRRQLTIIYCRWISGIEHQRHFTFRHSEYRRAGKDASSTAIYGSQGANGVVIVTTKQAQGGKTKVSYNGFVQTKRLSKRLEVLDPFEYALLNYEYGELSEAKTASNLMKKRLEYSKISICTNTCVLTTGSRICLVRMWFRSNKTSA